MERETESYHLLKGLPHFHDLSDQERRDIAQHVSVVRYKPKERLFKQFTRTSHILFIFNGLVKIFKENQNGKIVSLKLVSSGQFAGLDTYFGQTEYQYSAVCVSDTEALMIDSTVLTNKIMENGKFALTLIREISKDSLFIFNRLISQSTKQLPGRVADVLLYFAEEIFHSYQFSFPLPRHELAELAGSTKESFIRTINEFKHDKIIELDGREVNIISLELVKILSELG